MQFFREHFLFCFVFQIMQSLFEKINSSLQCVCSHRAITTDNRTAVPAHKDPWKHIPQPGEGGVPRQLEDH